MKLFIYDKFWDAFIGLNKATQVKVTEFISKFRTNSKSAAIHLESINTFKDQSLKTARIDQKYRAILKEVKASEVYLLTWVDNHDEAMDWAKNKKIDWNEDIQSFQVFNLKEEVKELKLTTSSETLFMGMYGDKDLKKIGVPEILIPSILKVSDYDDLEKIEPYLPFDVFENLFYLLDGASLDNILTEIAEGLSRNESEKYSSQNNRRSFIELTDDNIFNEALLGSLHKWKYYLHPSQATFVNRDFKGAIKLSGGAGTGKTVVALHRLKYLASELQNDIPILFTTFTKELTDNIKVLADELNIPKAKYRVKNIDALAFQLATKYGLLKPTDKVFGLSSVKKPEEVWSKVLDEELTSFDEEFLQEEYEEVILMQNVNSLDGYLKASRVGRGKAISRKDRMVIWRLVDSFNNIKELDSLFYKEEVYNLVSSFLLENEYVLFSHIIVDELQDFSNIELQFIRSLTSEGENDLFLVGDPFQNIYNKRINFSNAGINIRGSRSRRLRINYRTTEEIKSLAFSVLKNTEFDNFDGKSESKKGYLSLFHGVNPEYNLYRTKQEELDAVSKDIQQLIIDGYSYNDVVVASRTNDALNDFRNYFHQHNTPYTTKNLLNKSSEGVRLTTFHGMKGLEFKHVFLVDVNNRTLPKLPYNYRSLLDVSRPK